MDRPIPADYVDYKTLRVEVLNELLAIERQRLAQAVEMERTRQIVFPETTVIAKDVQRLVDALGRADDKPTTAASLDALDLQDIIAENGW